MAASVQYLKNFFCNFTVHLLPHKMNLYRIFKSLCSRLLRSKNCFKQLHICLFCASKCPVFLNIFYHFTVHVLPYKMHLCSRFNFFWKLYFPSADFLRSSQMLLVRAENNENISLKRDLQVSNVFTVLRNESISVSFVFFIQRLCFLRVPVAKCICFKCRLLRQCP